MKIGAPANADWSEARDGLEKIDTRARGRILYNTMQCGYACLEERRFLFSAPAEPVYSIFG